jgi:hypothetical protein
MPAQDRKQIMEELEDLQLQEAREAAEDRKMVRASRANRVRAIELSLKRDAANQAQIKAACVHRKGGKGTAQIYQGNDANYAVVTHTLSHGVTIVVCQRCGNVWEPPAALPKKATPEQKAKYKEDLTEYRRALNLPTDNEPSGTTLFSFTPIDTEAA